MTHKEQHVTGWKFALILFFFTSVVESVGMSHVFSFLPVYLQDMHVGHVSTWVGILSAITFGVGLPLVPLWGVWAKRFGGKTVVIRSAYVEMLVFMLLGWTHAFAGVFVAMALVGFQLGNTGIMLSSIRKLVPNHQVGFAVSLFSVSSPIGAALGPLIGGWLTNIRVLDLHSLFLLDGVLSFLTGTVLLVFYHEGLRPTPTFEGTKASAWTTAWESVRYTFSLKVTWVLFGVYTTLMMARQMVNPYIPLVILSLYPEHDQITMVIGGIMGLTALVGAVITVFAGKLGDKVGFTRILVIAFSAGIPVSITLGLWHHMTMFAGTLTVFSAVVSMGGAMVFALFSTRIPESHRSTALNLVYLPLYLGGIVGPVVSSGLSRAGLFGPFAGASVVFALGLVLIAVGMRKQPRCEVVAHAVDMR